MIRHEVVKCRIIRVAESIRSEGVKDTDMGGGKGTRKCEKESAKVVFSVVELSGVPLRQYPFRFLTPYSYYMYQLMYLQAFYA